MNDAELQMAGITLAGDIARMCGEPAMVVEIIRAAAEKEFGGNVICAALFTMATVGYCAVSIENQLLRAELTRIKSEGN